MIRGLRPGWLDARHESRSRKLALAPLAVLSGPYAAAAWLHRGLYERGWLKRRRLSCRVVSVGNLTVGGSGKTPASAWLARGLRRRGWKVALASRGYRRREREPVLVVSDGRRVHAGVEQAGDEPLLLAAHAPGVAVLVGRDRAVVALRAIAAFGAEVVVLDDGFQHHRLARDVEIVCFDGATGLGNGWVLPRGPLRERVSALWRADAILVVDGPLPRGDASRIGAHAPGATWFAARRRPLGVRPLGGGELEPLEALRDSKVGLVTGIASPGSLRRTVEALGARVVAERLFPDHHRFQRRDLVGLDAQAPVWITTEKDAMKVLPEWVGDATVVSLPVELEPEEPERVLDWLERRLRGPRG